MRRFFGMTAASAVAFVSVGASSLQAQNLVSIPDNAIAMIKVNNLEKTSQKLGALMQQWGIAQQQPMFADPLAAAQNMGNLQQGLNKAGEAAFVILNTEALPPENRAGEPFVIMLPVTDYAAFLKNFPDAEADGEVSAITMPINQEPAYVAKWGSFAAISANKALVAAPLKATKATGLSARQFTESDIVAYVNFAGFRDQATLGMGFGRMAVIGQIDQAANQDPQKAKYAPAGKVFINQFFNGLEHVINETQALTLALNLSDDGIHITEMAEFTADSYLGKYVTQWKTPEASFGKGLPKGPYAMVAGSALDGKTTVQLIDDMLGPVVTEAKKLGPEVQPVVDYIDSIKESLLATRTASYGMSNGQGKPGEAPLFEINAIVEGDAPKITAAQDKMGKTQDQFQKLMSSVQPGNQPVTSMQVAKGARTVSGVTFDELTTTVQGGDETQRKMLELIYGKDGMKMLYAAVDADTVLLTTNKQDAQIASAVAAAKSNTDAFANSAPTKQVAAKLPKSPFVSGYFYADQLMTMVSRASEAFTGVALQTQVPPETQPLAFSASTEGTAVRFDLFLPSPLVKTLVQTVMQQAMKGPNNPNPGM